MFENIESKLSKLRLLLLLPLLIGLVTIIVNSYYVPVDKVVLPGIATIVAKQGSDGNYYATKVIDNRPVSLDRVRINSSGYDALIRCPGLNKKVVNLIINERNHKKFLDWRDLKDRIRGINDSKVEMLIDAGVKL